MFNFLKNLTRTKNTGMSDSRLLSDIRNWYSWGADGVFSSRITDNVALTCSALFTCIRIRAEIGASLPIGMYRYGDKTKQNQTDHPIARVLRYPNYNQTKVELWQQLIASLDLRGNAYCYINRVGNKVVELLPIHVDNIKVSVADDGSIEYKTRIKTQEKIFRNTEKNREILHIKSMSTDGVIGISPVDMLSGTISTAVEQQRQHSTMVANGAKPSGIITLPHQMTPEALINYKNKIMGESSGRRAGGTLLLDGGATFQGISLTPEQMQAIQSRKFTHAQIAAAYRIPPYMIGDQDGIKISNVEELGLQFYQYSLLPMIDLIQERLALDLLTDIERDQYYFEHNADGILRGDVKSRYEAYMLSIMYGIRSPDEVRAKENLPPRSDGLGGQYFYPANLLKPSNEESGDMKT